ncbi:MAG: hypothetical protein GWN87_21255, partial [Desulfuromonadales bacterium]|nr:hypothetical protein [Desulfuromonadales bacterium]
TVSSAPAGAATGGGGLEERVKQLENKTATLDKPKVSSGSENVRLAISGQINRGVLITDDG